MLYLVKTISTEYDKIKRRVVKILRFGNGDVQTSLEVAAYGVDSNPIKDMIAIYAETSERGKTVIIGYINKNQLAQPGEFRNYSTDAAGALKFYTWLKNDGTYEIGGSAKNLIRFQETESGFNQLRTDLNTLIAAFNAHVHVTPSGPSNAPTPVLTVIPVSNSSASISDAKIDEIKTL